MRKKAISLALALVMCLGLTVPAFAETITEENYFGDGIDMTGQYDGGLTASLSYTGSGELTAEHAEVGVHLLFSYLDYPLDVDNVISVSIGQGLTVTDSWKEAWDYMADTSSFSVSFSDGTTVQPEQPDAPAAYQVSNWAKDRVAQAVEAGLAPEGLGTDYRVNITRAQFAATAVKLYEAMSGETIAPAAENPFSDTDDPEVLKAAAAGFVGGVGGGRFAPGDLLTREQAAVMFAAVYTKLGVEIPAVTATAFADDASISGWARNAVAFMNGEGIIGGVGDNSFAPKGNASIEQALIIALNMLEM